MYLNDITDIVYDKLMGNSDMLDLNLVEEQEVHAHSGSISFTYKDTKVIISVSIEK